MNDIFTLAKDVILNKGFDLGEKLRELTAIMIVGQISVDDYQTLTKLAYENADAEAAQQNILAAFKTINTEIANVKARLTVLEKVNAVVPEEDEYPAWERWNGQPDSGYKFGDKITHLGVKYISNYVGLNVWEPGLQGTETLWSKIE